MINNITSITLCKVNFTPTNQLYFDSYELQNLYFSNILEKRTFNNCNYQDRSGLIDIAAYVDDLNKYNYGWYINNYKGVSKKYYFWIVSKDLLSPETTRIQISSINFH